MSQFTSSYLSARLKVFSTRLIGFERLIGMVELGLEQILLKVNEYTGHSYQLDDKTADSIEKQLVHRALGDFRILMRPYSGSERRFFDFAIHWFELVNLKVLIRGKFSSTGTSKIQQQLIELGDFAELPLKKLLETEDPYEMLRLLETTSYGGIVRQARHVFEEHGNDLFLLDATIDKRFFIDLHQRTRFLSQRDAKQLGQLMSILLDRFNLLWLLRYRFSYGLSPAKSYYLLTAMGHKLHSTELMNLAKLDSIELFLAALPEPLNHLLAGHTVISDIETVMDYFTLVAAADVLNKSHNLLARTFAYTLLREAEVRLLVALIKGKQLGFDTQLIRQAIAGAYT